MVEPITAAAVAAGTAIAKASGDDDGQEKARLIARILGPSADSLGTALARWVDYRLRNVGRIVEVANRYSLDDNASVPPRIAHQLIEDGSYCDDELMTEYLGGLLATARTPSGRDDRAITWTTLITQMSVFEIRAHYLITTEYLARLREWDEQNPTAGGKSQPLTVFIDAMELARRLQELAPNAEPWGLLEHAVAGLMRHDLTSSLLTSYGLSEGMRGNSMVRIPDNLSCEYTLFATPGPAPIELWGHAHGIAAHSNAVIDQAQPYIDQSLIPRLQYSEMK